MLNDCCLDMQCDVAALHRSRGAEAETPSDCFDYCLHIGHMCVFRRIGTYYIYIRFEQ